MKGIKIGETDYSRDEIEDNKCGAAFGTSADYFLSVIREYEEAGYSVKFETSLWRRLFSLCKYVVVAYEN